MFNHFHMHIIIYIKSIRYFNYLNNCFINLSNFKIFVNKNKYCNIIFQN